MNTKDVLLVGAGVVLGYLLVGYVNKTKANAQATTGSTGATVDQAKIDSCNKSVADFMATAKFAQGFAQGADLEAMKKAKFDACMSAQQ